MPLFFWFFAQEETKSNSRLNPISSCPHLLLAMKTHQRRSETETRTKTPAKSRPATSWCLAVNWDVHDHGITAGNAFFFCFPLCGFSLLSTISCCVVAKTQSCTALHNKLVRYLSVMVVLLDLCVTSARLIERWCQKTFKDQKGERESEWERERERERERGNTNQSDIKQSETGSDYNT